MGTLEENRLFAELKRRGVSVEPNLLKEQNDFDPSAGTSSAQPTSDDGHVQPSVAYAGGITSGRGNPSERSGGLNMPPKIPGANAAPMPPQLTGSNEPGSTIRQLPPVTQQYPGQVIAIPQNLLASSQERSYTDPSRASPFASPLIQPVPMDHQHAGTIPQQSIPTPSSQDARYPGDFNKPSAIPMNKPDAADSDSVQNLSDKFVSAGVPKKRVIS